MRPLPDPAAAPADEVWRLFVAVPIDDSARNTLAGLQSRWRRLGADVGWVRPENLHLTLAFLGDTPVGHADNAIRAVDDAAAGRASFDIELEGVGWFGRPERPRVIWAGVTAPRDLEVLWGDLSARLRAAGFALEDRPFAVHITLGRVRSSRGLTALTSALQSSTNNATWGRVRVAELQLMRSVLTAGGPVYSVVHSAALKG